MAWSIEDFVIPSIVGSGIVYMGIQYLRDMVRTRSAQSWPKAKATIGSASPRSVSGDAGVTWFVRVAYSYTVDGDYYGGYTDRRMSSEEVSIEYSRWCVGRTFPIRYKASQPDNSEVLDHEWIAAMPYPPPAS